MFMKVQPRLTIAIATTQARASRLTSARLPRLSDVCYDIFIQGSELPALSDLDRPDIALHLTEGKGAARNRNAALERVSTPFLLFADDDLEFSPEGFAELLARFEAAPEADFLCARLSDEDGNPRKRYSANGVTARWWNCGKVGTPELALRVERFRAKRMAFDTRFGAGMPDHLGDEYIFLCDALRAGLKGRHVGITVASHPRESSGTIQSAAKMDIRKRVLARALGPWKSRPALLAFSLRHNRRFARSNALDRIV